MIINMMTFIWLLSSSGWAGPIEDLQLASNPNLSVDQRMSAFDRLVLLGATDVRVIREYCLGEEKETTGTVLLTKRQKRGSRLLARRLQKEQTLQGNRSGIGSAQSYS